MERLAVLPFENLTADPSLNWAGTALARVLAEELSASTRILPFTSDSAAAARLSNAARAIQGYYTADRGRVVFHAVVRNLASSRNEKWLESSPGGDPVLGAASEFAKQIDTRTRPFGTQNGAALKAWGESLVATDPARKTELLEKAIAADPGFGAAYSQLTQTYISSRDGARALEVAKRARERLSSFTDLDRARMELVSAELTNNAEERRTALVALSRLISTDAQTARSLADAELAARRFQTAVEIYRNAVALEPESPALLNLLGYAEAYNGNLDAARSALERYRALDPKGINPLDSLGEVHFFCGQFTEAEKYFLEAEKLQPGAATAVQVLKAAEARYLAGDTNGADAIEARAERAAASAGSDQFGEMRRAQWLYITGRRDQAMSAAETAARAQQSETAAFSALQLAIWKLDAGDRDRAKALAAAAASLTRNPGLQRSAAMVQSIAGAAAPSLDPVMQSAAHAYAALFGKDYAKASELFKALLARSSPASDGEFRTMIALALSETGKKDEARQLISRYFIPIGSSEDQLLATHAFPYFVELRRALGSTR